jgi:thioredoxin reductase (NADPH)
MPPATAHFSPSLPQAVAVKKKIYDCAVIGGGPAGLTAALYLCRFKRSVLLFQEGLPRAAWIPKTNNLLGYYRGLSGRALLKRLRSQLKGLELDEVNARARVKREKKSFLVETPGRTYEAKKIILALGIRDKQPPLPNLRELRKLGLLRYCPICDGFEHRDKTLFLLVGGEDCIRKVSFLHNYSKRLLVITPRNFFLSGKRRRDYRRMNARIIRGEVAAACPEGDGIRISLANGKSYSADAGYVELGFDLNDEAIEGIRGIRKTKSGLLVASAEQRLSVPGLFAAGDCVSGLAQISGAAGQAAIAATAVHNELLQEEGY